MREERVRAIKVHRVGDLTQIQVASPLLPTVRLLEALERIAAHASGAADHSDSEAAISRPASPTAVAELPGWWSGLPRWESSFLVALALALTITFYTGSEAGTSGGAELIGGIAVLSLLLLIPLWVIAYVAMAMVDWFRHR